MTPIERIAAISSIQSVLFKAVGRIKIDGVWGSESKSALEALVAPAPKPARTWPFSIKIVGDDFLVEDVVITCFGGWGTGIADPQDNGNTASGMNTRTRVVNGASIPMDGRYFSTLRPAEHRALDGSPIPRLLNDHGLTAWHTPVEVTIGDTVFTPPDGIVDLGPGIQASKPNEPHGLDLSVPAASHFSKKLLRQLANSFEARGSYRIIGGAKLVPPGWSPT